MIALDFVDFRPLGRFERVDPKKAGDRQIQKFWRASFFRGGVGVGGLQPSRAVAVYESNLDVHTFVASYPISSDWIEKCS